MTDSIANIVNFDDGDDTINIGAGENIVNAGGGDDLIVAVVDEFTDRINGGDGIDTLGLVSGGVTVNLLQGQFDGGFLTSIENVTFLSSSLGGVIKGSLANNRLIGVQGDDMLWGIGGDDTLDGGLGADTLAGGDDDDLLIGGGDVVIITASDGDGSVDTVPMNQETFIDILLGGSGNDTLIGANFVDANENGVYDFGEETLDDIAANELFGSTGNDLVFGGSRNDTLGGGGGDDTLNGGDGDDIVFSGDGDDSIDGGAGNDEIFNGGGNDIVLGGAGDDVLFGGLGADILTGGAGADIFAFYAGHGDDIITDFNLNDDTLDLSGSANDFNDLASIEMAASNIILDFADGSSRTDLLIQTGTGDSIVLEGLSTDDLASIDIVF